LPLVDDVSSLFSDSQRLLLFSKIRSIFKRAYEKKHFKTWRDIITTIFSWYDLQKQPFTEASPKSKWFVTALLDVASYNTELKMEIKLRKLRNISRHLFEEVGALKDAEAHTLGTTGLRNSHADNGQDTNPTFFKLFPRFDTASEQNHLWRSTATHFEDNFSIMSYWNNESWEIELLEVTTQPDFTLQL
jgi:hypothetical protein